MAYDGPFDDERTCYHCGSYMKKTLAACPNCAAPAGTGRFCVNNVMAWLVLVLVMAGIFIPLMIIVLLAASCPAGHLGTTSGSVC